MPQKMIQSIYHFHSKEGINMNKIYKVIWSKAKHTYVVASEIAKGHTKGETTGRGLKKLAAAMLVAAALLSPNFVWAADMVKVDESASDTAVEVYTKKGTDTQVNAAKTYTYRKVAAEEHAREAADTELNERITNEANEIHKTTNQLQSDLATETADRKAADEALDSRAKALEDKTEGITDGTTKDGQYVKADHYVGQNLNALDQGLQAETAARQAADTTLQTNIDNEAAERKAADTVLDDKITAETSARVAADTKLVEAVNSGLSLSNDNVLQKNTTTIDAQGNVTTSKTDANEMILNKGKDNQITLNENGIKVGTNSTVVDKDGVYTGGDTYAAAKAAMSADGKIKGANGAFTVDENGNVASKATITGETVTDGKGASMSNGTVTGKTLTDGIATITNGNINTSGSVTGGAIQGKSISDGTATMQNGNITGVKNLSAETITTSGDATIGGDLTVNGQLNVDEIDLTKSGIVGDNNVTASTKVAAGEITSYKKATSTKDGSEKESAIDYDENSTSTWAKATDADGNWNKSTLTVEGSDVTSKVVDSEKNSNLFTQTSTQSQSTLTDKDNNTNVSTQTASESSSVVSGKDGEKTYKSYITQNLKEILQKIEDGDGHVLTSTEQTETDITNTAKNGTIANEAKDITNHATENMTNTVGGKLLNDVTGDMENKVGGNLITTVSGTSTETVTGKKTETYNDGLETTVTGEEKHTVNGSQTNSITGDQVNTIGGKQTTTVTGDVTEDYKANLSTTVGGSQTTTVIGDSSLTAENINNTAKNKITNKALDVETDAASSIVSKVSNDAGSNTSTQLSYQTKEEMSQADGKTASYLRGAAEEKSQLTDGAKKTTIDTVAGQTNTNITDGTNISNSLQKADQAASSVTDGTNTTVVNQDAKSLASSITDGAKANNTSSTVDASVQRIQTDDTHYSVSSKSASKMEDALFNGSTVIDSLKDAEKGLVSTAVTDGTNLTGSSMTAKGITSSAAESIVNEIGDGSAVKSEMTANGITNTAKDGTITNDAKDLVNTASNSITDKVGENVERTMTTEKIQDKVGKTTVTTTDGLTKLTNEGGTHKTEMDFADVLKDLGVRGNATVDKKLTVKGDSDLQGNATVGKDLEVKGSTKLDGTLEVVGKSTFKDDVTMEKNLDVKGITTTDKLVVNNGATVAGGTTTDTLHVTSTATFDDIVTMKKDLSVGGNVDAASYTVKDTGIKIDKNGINAGGTKVTGLAPADISHAGSTDAVSGGQLYETNTRVSGLETRMGTVETRVDKLDNKIDKVGANAAAMANLHPLEFDEDSKWNVAAAVGSSGSETASAVGVFYRPNENVMVNASAAMGTGENMFGGGVSLRLGHGGNKAKEAQMKAAAAENKELRAKVDDLTARMDALLSVLNPNMSKDFPDVPENHWAYEAVSRLAGNGIVEGYEDGKYHGERQMTRYEMAEIIYNALSKGAKAEKKLVEEFRPELQAMAVQKKA